MALGPQQQALVPCLQWTHAQALAVAMRVLSTTQDCRRRQQHSTPQLPFIPKHANDQSSSFAAESEHSSQLYMLCLTGSPHMQ